MPTLELIVGLDLGRVIRVIPGHRRDELSPRAKAQLAFFGERPKPVIATEQLYLLDVQAVERTEDEPGADDSLFLYGMLRGPYPSALDEGVVAVDGQLRTSRGAVLHGLALGTHGAFATEGGACGSRVVHAIVPGGPVETPSVVLAFPLVPMGDDATNELVAAQLFHDVIGALRTDLGDDLANDPVPVPSRARHERELERAGWVIQGEYAVQKSAGRPASLFKPAKKQRLPREAKLDELSQIGFAQFHRLPPRPEIVHLREVLGIERNGAILPSPPKSAPARVALPGLPPSAPPPPIAAPPVATPPDQRRKRPPTPVGFGAPERPATKRRRDTWIKVQVEQHQKQHQAPPKVTSPGRVESDEAVAAWMYEQFSKPENS